MTKKIVFFIAFFIVLSGFTFFSRSPVHAWVYQRVCCVDANTPGCENHDDLGNYGSPTWGCPGAGGCYPSFSGWWGSCTGSCGTGTMYYYTHSNDCGGTWITNSQSCNTGIPCCNGVPVSCTGWGTCSVTCGGGTQSRTCYDQGCGSAIPQSQACNTQACNTAPNTPTISAPTNGATNVSLTPVITLSTTDPDNDYLRYKIQLATDTGFTANLQTFDETASQTGWSGQNAQTSTAYNSGSTATYTIQSALSQNVLYYIRAYAKDPGGTNTWSSVSTSVSFTTTGIANAPVISSPANGTTGTSLNPQLQLSTTDGQSDYLRYKIQLATDTGFTANLQTFDETASQTGWSGQNAQTSTAYNSGSTATYTIQSALTGNTTYYIRAYAVDPGGSNVWSSVSTTVSFATNASPAAPVISAPADGTTGLGLLPVIQLSTTDPESNYVQFQIQLATNTGFTQNLQTFDETASQTGWSGQNAQTSTAYNSGSTATYTVQSNLTYGTVYYIRAFAKDPSGSLLWGGVSSTTSFTIMTLNAPSNCSVSATVTTGPANIAWTDNSTIEDNYLLETSVNNGAFSAPVTLPANTVTSSQTVANGTYEYRIRVVSAGQYSSYCTTAAVLFPLTNFQIQGIRLDGIQIR